MQDTVDFRKTVNLPRTAFPMKANLPQNEAELLARWDETRLCNRIRQARAGRPLFMLHDGPPYANNRIHAGTAFNKVLLYVPGWDCRGQFPLLEEYAPELPALFIVSQVALDRQPGDPLSVEVERAAGDKRERCRKYTTEVGAESDWPTPCAACAEAVEEMRKASV